MRRAWIGVLCCVGLLAGCKAEPTYRGVSVITYNYTPWDLELVQIIDASGSVAGTGMVPSGGGEGSVSCCYTLSGTDFTVKWRGGDADLMRKHMVDGKFDEVMFSKETTLHFPAANMPPGDGPAILELHIYPDEHMELALSRKLFGQVRIPIVGTTRWLYQNHRDALNDYRSIHEVRYVLAKVAKQAWTKYKIEDAQDMRQYMRLYFTVASNFDANPHVKEILSKPGRAPGDFARAITELPPTTIDQIKAAGSPPGDKNA
ncbi:hypothetical protein D3C86_713710 [compost metagenome]